MDRIQEAIQRAREQRTGQVGQVPPAEPRAPAQAPAAQDADAADRLLETYLNADAPPPAGAAAQPAPAPAAPAPAPAPRAPTEGIAYTQTRQLQHDPQRLSEHRVIAGLEHDQRVEAYRQLRTQVLRILRDNQWNTLAITSPGERAGKSLTAANLAISLSREVNHTVMLVDLDLRKPTQHELFGIDVQKGLVDYLNGQASFDEVLVNPGFPRLVVLPGRALGKYSSEILSSPQMKSLVADIRGRYQDRIIVFDLPPLLRNDDALMFTPTVDATLMVVEDGVSTRADVERCLQLLEGSRLIGTILNKARG